MFSEVSELIALVLFLILHFCCLHQLQLVKKLATEYTINCWILKRHICFLHGFFPIALAMTVGFLYIYIYE